MKTSLLLIFILIFLSGCDYSKPSLVSLNGKTFEVEIADTQLERAQGLMFRKELKENSGMLFIFPESDKHSFWMKNTFIPLDIIWIDENFKIVYIYENAQPCRDICDSITPSKDARYVLEINSGLAEKYNFNMGDRVEIT
ncbi:MAG TPA: DUF192 domain-containing protein [Candidatus Nanoarchaeia archaeon]|nr:DUF192 domain-containing protein [Candidatus Nanoarchaeia archaeon]